MDQKKVNLATMLPPNSVRNGMPAIVPLLDFAERPVLDLLQALLLACREDEFRVKAALKSRKKGTDIHDPADQLYAELQGEMVEYLSVELLTYLEDFIESYVDHFKGVYPPSVAYRIIIQALDLTLDVGILDLIRAEGRDLEVDDSTLVYTPQPDLRAMTQMGRLSTPPSHQNISEPTAALNFRLAHELFSEYHGVIRYSQFHLVQRVFRYGLPKIATVHPHIDVSEFDVIEDKINRVFGPVTPKPWPEFDFTLINLLNAAALKGASIVVLPELCIGPSQLTVIQTWFAGQEQVKLIVAGSQHVPCPDQHNVLENQATILLKGADAPDIHRKIHGFEYMRRDEKSLYENIQPGNTITVYPSRSFDLTCLICSDVSDEMMDLIASLGVNVLLVASMSPVVGVFEKRFAHLLDMRQAFVVMANNPVEWPSKPKAARAVFCFPLDNLVAGIRRYPPYPDHPASSERGIVCCSLASGDLEWEPVSP